MAGHVTNELARLAPAFSSNFTSVTSPLVGPGADASFLEQLDRIYPAPIANYSYNTDTYPNAQLRGLSVSDDYNAKCAAPMIVRAARARGQTAYEFRMPSQPAYLGSTHSSDSYYLQNSTASMNGNSTEIGVALEWRAYVASFIRHGDPNTEKLSTAPKWYQSSAETRYEPRIVISKAQRSAPHLGRDPTNTGMEITNTLEWERCKWWSEEDVIAITRQ